MKTILFPDKCIVFFYLKYSLDSNDVLQCYIESFIFLEYKYLFHRRIKTEKDEVT